MDAVNTAGDPDAGRAAERAARAAETERAARAADDARVDAARSAGVQAQEPSLRCLVTGATGYIGGRLVPGLLDAGHSVRCLARTPGRLRDHPWADRVQVAQGDVTDAESLRRAMRDIDVAYYLVHAIGTGSGFEATDRRAARVFAEQAREAGVRRIVYLGGLTPAGVPERDEEGRTVYGQRALFPSARARGPGVLVERPAVPRRGVRRDGTQHRGGGRAGRGREDGRGRREARGGRDGAGPAGRVTRDARRRQPRGWRSRSSSSFIVARNRTTTASSRSLNRCRAASVPWASGRKQSRATAAAAGA